MASEGAPPPPYNTAYPPADAPPQYASNPAPYPTQAPYPSTAPPGYSAVQDQPKGYAVGGQAPYPQQAGYGLPAYPAPQGAATGYTTQGVGVGHQQHTQTTIITQPAHGAVFIHNTAPPPDFMVLSIISTFCCFCIGIFALIKSIRSRDLYRAGDHAAAQEKGLQARKIAYAGIIVAVLIYVFIVVMRIILSITLN